MQELREYLLGEELEICVTDGLGNCNRDVHVLCWSYLGLVEMRVSKVCKVT